MVAAAHFLVEQSNLDFNAVFKKGVPYLTKAEELELTSQHYAALNAVYEDMDIEPQYEPFVSPSIPPTLTTTSNPPDKRNPLTNRNLAIHPQTRTLPQHLPTKQHPLRLRKTHSPPSRPHQIPETKDDWQIDVCAGH